jgi:hypothetical protein
MRLEKNRLCGSTLFIRKEDLWNYVWFPAFKKSPPLYSKMEALYKAIENNPGNPLPFSEYQYKWLLNELRKTVPETTDLRVEAEQ